MESSNTAEAQQPPALSTNTARVEPQQDATHLPEDIQMQYEPLEESESIPAQSLGHDTSTATHIQHESQQDTTTASIQPQEAFAPSQTIQTTHSLISRTDIDADAPSYVQSSSSITSDMITEPLTTETTLGVVLDATVPLNDASSVPLTEPPSDSTIPASAASKRAEKSEKHHSLDEGAVVPHFRLIIDQSVVAGLLDHAYTDARYEVMGYLGGSIKAQVPTTNGKQPAAETPTGEVVCHACHFIASERSVKSLVAANDESMVEEVESAYNVAIRAFRVMGLDLVGWYRSSHRSGKLEPRAEDLFKQQRLQAKHKHAVGMLVSVPTLPRLSIFSSTPSYNEMVDEIVPFRVPTPRKGLSRLLADSTNARNGMSSTNGPAAPNGTSDTTSVRSIPKPHRVVYGINQQVYLAPAVMRQMTHTLQTGLNESRQAHSLQEKDLMTDSKQVAFAQSDYSAFLLNAIRNSVGQFNQGMTQEYRTLALNRHHLKTQLAHKLDQIAQVVDEYQHRKKEWERYQREQEELAAGLQVKSEEGNTEDSFTSSTKRREVMQRLVWAVVQENAYIESHEAEASTDIQSKLNVLYWNNSDGQRKTTKRGGRRPKPKEEGNDTQETPQAEGQAQ